VQATNTRPRFDVVADAHGICSHVGAALLAELADRLGLTSELGRRANLGVRAHDRGQVLRDLVVTLADGGDCVSDLASLRNQPELFGQVASVPTAWRVLAEELPADPRGIAGLWSARSGGPGGPRRRWWRSCRRPGSGTGSSLTSCGRSSSRCCHLRLDPGGAGGGGPSRSQLPRRDRHFMARTSTPWRLLPVSWAAARRRPAGAG
jgi:Transposase DDE domain group 1